MCRNAQKDDALQRFCKAAARRWWHLPSKPQPLDQPCIFLQDGPSSPTALGVPHSRGSGVRCHLAEILQWTVSSASRFLPRRMPLVVSLSLGTDGAASASWLPQAAQILMALIFLGYAICTCLGYGWGHPLGWVSVNSWLNAGWKEDDIFYLSCST